MQYLCDYIKCYQTTFDFNKYIIYFINVSIGHIITVTKQYKHKNIYEWNQNDT